MLPIVKLTVEHMQQEILHAFATHHEEYQKALEAGLSEAIKTFDFEKEVSEIATRQLTVACDELVKNVVRDVVWDSKFRQKLKKAMLQKLMKTKNL